MTSLDKGSKLGSFINEWGKIFGYAIFIVVAGTVTYFQIFDNKASIESIERKEKSHNKRVMEESEKLRGLHDEDVKRIIELEKGQSEIKGYLKAYRELK